MITPATETNYALTFRQDDAKKLGELISNRHSVVLIGLKRVGISNFLKFFLFHPRVKSTYIKDADKHLFIHLDLNDLVERELFPFWILTLKRIVDAVKESTLPDTVKKDIESEFLTAIQSEDLFLVIDSIRQCILKIIDQGYQPTIFFIRFDRMKDAATPAFISNLRGLYEASGRHLMYIFTSYRDLEDFSEIFKNNSLTLYSQNMYIKPATLEDQKIIFEADRDRFHLNLDNKTEEQMLNIVGGYSQYLFLALISLHNNPQEFKGSDDLHQYLTQNESIRQQTEELWENLNETEKIVLQKVSHDQQPTDEERQKAKYLWNSGFVSEDNGTIKIFSPLFEYFIEHQETTENGSGHPKELTSKENQLFNYLKEHLDQICEREDIINTVWPEEEEIGVTDWAVDRLVARVRSKLKSQNSEYEIVTVKTRGYKLTTT